MLHICTLEPGDLAAVSSGDPSVWGQLVLVQISIWGRFESGNDDISALSHIRGKCLLTLVQWVEQTRIQKRCCSKQLAFLL